MVRMTADGFKQANAIDGVEPAETEGSDLAFGCDCDQVQIVSVMFSLAQLQIGVRFVRDVSERSRDGLRPVHRCRGEPEAANTQVLEGQRHRQTWNRTRPGPLRRVRLSRPLQNQ